VSGVGFLREEAKKINRFLIASRKKPLKNIAHT
jgi:hypothetical protein